jgi:SAM-dependent methyltransferase
MSDEPNRNSTFDYARALTPAELERGWHRVWAGGRWDVMGPKQLEFLVDQGLSPVHRLLDVGCGPLRAGIHFVGYLEPGNYYGVEINESLLDAGYDRELPPALRDRLPRDHLRATERFECAFGVPFDFAIAQSLFTHISLNQIRLCLFRVAQQLTADGRFFATFFEAPAEHPLDQPLAGGRRWTERNAFFYYRRDLKWAARRAGCEFRYIGDWGHPADQRMVEFRRARSPATDQGAAGTRRLSRLRAALRRAGDAPASR